MLSITAGITAIKATLELTQLVSDLVSRPNIDAVDIRSKLHELLIHAVSAQSALAEAGIEMAELRRQLDDRESLKALDDDMDFVIDGGFYIKKSETAKGLIPYCPVCWKVDSRTVHLDHLKGPGLYSCTLHKSYYATAEHNEWADKRAEEKAKDRYAGV